MFPNKNKIQNLYMYAVTYWKKGELKFWKEIKIINNLKLIPQIALELL